MTKKKKPEKGDQPETASSACWQKHARIPPQHPTACCERDSAGSQRTDPESNRTNSLKADPYRSDVYSVPVLRDVVTCMYSVKELKTCLATASALEKFL